MRHVLTHWIDLFKPHPHRSSGPKTTAAGRERMWVDKASRRSTAVDDPLQRDLLYTNVDSR